MILQVFSVERDFQDLFASCLVQLQRRMTAALSGLGPGIDSQSEDLSVVEKHVI